MPAKLTEAETLQLLKENADERGQRHWEKLGENPCGMESFGIGLTKLRKLAKKVGKDHALAERLWGSNNHDVKIVGLLVDEPKKITREQVERQVEGVRPGLLAHVFSSCDAPLAKSPVGFEAARDWMDSKDELRRSCAYGLVYELSKDKKDPRLDDAFFLDCVKRIHKWLGKETGRVRLAMGAALMGIGRRNKELNKVAVELAKEVSPVEYDSGHGGCGTFDVLKHLTSADVKKKFGLD